MGINASRSAARTSCRAAGESGTPANDPIRAAPDSERDTSDASVSVHGDVSAAAVAVPGANRVCSIARSRAWSRARSIRYHAAVRSAHVLDPDRGAVQQAVTGAAECRVLGGAAGQDQRPLEGVELGQGGDGPGPGAVRRVQFVQAVQDRHDPAGRQQVARRQDRAAQVLTGHASGEPVSERHGGGVPLGQAHGHRDRPW